MQISIVSLYVYLLMNIYYIDRHNEVKALATTVLHSSASILTCHGAYTYVVHVCYSVSMEYVYTGTQYNSSGLKDVPVDACIFTHIQHS